MSRSLRKGPYIQEALEKRILAMNDGSKKKEVVKTWSRASMISPDFVGHTVAVHNGNKFIPVYITENMVGHKLGDHRHQLCEQGGSREVCRSDDGSVVCRYRYRQPARDDSWSDVGCQYASLRYLECTGRHLSCICHFHLLHSQEVGEVVLISYSMN